MTDEKLAELMRQQAQGMRAMSNEEMARRQFEAAHGARNAWPDAIDSASLAQASMNFWRQEGPFIQPPKTPARRSIWDRLGALLKRA